MFRRSSKKKAKPLINEACAIWGVGGPAACAGITLVCDSGDSFQVATQRAAARISKVIAGVNAALRAAKPAEAASLQAGEEPVEGIYIGITGLSAQQGAVALTADPALWDCSRAQNGGPFSRFVAAAGMKPPHRQRYQGMVVVMGFLPGAIKRGMSGWGHAFTVELFLHENPFGWELGTDAHAAEGLKIDSGPGGVWQQDEDIGGVVYVCWRLREAFVDPMPKGSKDSPLKAKLESKKHKDGSCPPVADLTELMSQAAIK